MSALSAWVKSRRQIRSQPRKRKHWRRATQSKQQLKASNDFASVLRVQVLTAARVEIFGRRSTIEVLLLIAVEGACQICSQDKAGKGTGQSVDQRAIIANREAGHIPRRWTRRESSWWGNWKAGRRSAGHTWETRRTEAWRWTNRHTRRRNGHSWHSRRWSCVGHGPTHHGRRSSCHGRRCETHPTAHRCTFAGSRLHL